MVVSFGLRNGAEADWTFAEERKTKGEEGIPRARCQHHERLDTYGGVALRFPPRR
jgi:hypothetical protein